MALNQVGIATTVTTPILIAALAAVVGVIVVGVGGGLVKPMQGRWESYLAKAEQEAPRIRREAANAPSLTQTQAPEATQHLESHVGRDPGYTPQLVPEIIPEAGRTQDGARQRPDPSLASGTGISWSYQPRAGDTQVYDRPPDADQIFGDGQQGD